MANLIPLSNIPYSARRGEAAERAKWPSRDMALDAATMEIVVAAGCYGGPYAPTVGYVLTLDAAKALAARLTHMPDGTSHRRLSYTEDGVSSDALGEYIEAVARGANKAAALEAYQAARQTAVML